MRMIVRDRESILHRLAEIGRELSQTRADLRTLNARDPRTTEIVSRGARLSYERTVLERRLQTSEDR
jgi:hypothetical protein